MSGQRRYPPELRERAVSVYRAAEPKPVIRQMARRLGVRPEGLRTWIRADQGRPVDKHPGRTRPAVSRRVVGVAELPVEVAEELDVLRLEVVELRRANEILRAAGAYFAATLERAGRPSWGSSTSTGARSGSSCYSGS